MKQKGFAPVLILILVIALGMVGYFSFKNIKPAPSVNTSATQMPVTGATSETNNDWKVYKNSKYNFSVKYPPTGFYRINCKNEEDKFFLTLGNYPDMLTPQDCGRDSRYNIEIFGWDEPFVVDSRYKYTLENWKISGMDVKHFVFEPKTELDGPGESWYEEVFFQNNGQFFNAYNRNKENSDIFKKMVSTLKFDDALVKKNLEGWKNFQTPDAKISFLYPNDFQVINQNTTSEGWGKPITVAHIKKGDITVALGEASFMNECMDEVSSFTVQISGNLFIKKVFKGHYSGGNEACSNPETAKLREIWIQPVSKETDPHNYVHGLMIGYTAANAAEAEDVFYKVLSTLKYSQ